MSSFCVEITYHVTGNGGFQNPKESRDYIAAYVHKNADNDFKPNSYRLDWFRNPPEFSHQTFDSTSPCGMCEYNSIIFDFYKDFDNRTDLVLWVQKTEKLLDKFLEDHKDDIQKTPITRVKHSIFQKVIKKRLLWKKEVWREI